LLSLPAAAQDLALRGGTVLTITGDTIENGIVVIQKGRITAVGRALAIPPNLKVIDAAGNTSCPDSSTAIRTSHSTARIPMK